MGRAEDEQKRVNRQMENLLGDLEKLIPFFDNKTVTDVYVYGEGNVHTSEFGKGTSDTGVVLSTSERMRIINSLASVSGTPLHLSGGLRPKVSKNSLPCLFKAEAVGKRA